MNIEDKILKILSEDVPYEVIGGPTPSETQQTPLDYTKPVSKATVPQATPIDGVGQIGDELKEDEEASDKDDDKSDDDSKDEKKDTLEETFAALLRRLVEEEEDEKDEDDKDEDKDDLKEDEPKETLPTVDSKLDDPAALVNQAPGIQVAEDEDKDSDDDDDDEDKDDDKKELDEEEPAITLPSVDSLLDDPSALVNQAPGSPVAEDEDKDSDDDKKDDDKKDDVCEDINAIFAGVKLSEELKSQAATIFQAAVTRRVNEAKAALAKNAASKLTEAFDALQAQFSKKQNVFESKLSGQVDSYLNYVVENWMKENRLAVERGIRAELAENFITGLKKLFVENYIEVPQSKVDVVATLGNKVTKLEAKLNEQVQTNIQLRTSVNAYRKEEVVRAVGAGLTDTQSDKLAKLAEGVEYTTKKEFATKLKALKESYFPKAAAPKQAEPLMEAKKNDLDDEMSAYTSAIAKSKK
jgi:hypothetical protein